MRRRKISKHKDEYNVHIDCCRFKLSNSNLNDLFFPEEKLSSGCDLAFVDNHLKVCIYAEVKRGRITLKDASTIIKQLNLCADKLKCKYGKRVLLVFIHCGSGRIDASAKRYLNKEKIRIIPSEVNITEKICEFA